MLDLGSVECDSIEMYVREHSFLLLHLGVDTDDIDINIPTDDRATSEVTPCGTYIYMQGNSSGVGHTIAAIGKSPDQLRPIVGPNAEFIRIGHHRHTFEEPLEVGFHGSTGSHVGESVGPYCGEHIIDIWLWENPSFSEYAPESEEEFLNPQDIVAIDEVFVATITPT